MKHERLQLEPAAAAVLRALPFDEGGLHPQPAGFLWCIHCERAYLHGGVRHGAGQPPCPYLGCEDAGTDAWDWARVRAANPAYPGTPSQGVVYPLFGKGRYHRR